MKMKDKYLHTLQLLIEEGSSEVQFLHNLPSDFQFTISVLERNGLAFVEKHDAWFRYPSIFGNTLI